MGTTSDEIYDLFMLNIMNDNILNNIYTTSGSAAAVIYAEPWLMRAIDTYARFCTEDLTYTESDGTVVGYFTATLSRRSRNILARAMTKYWLEQQVSNAIAFGRFFSDREFRMSAPMLPSLQNYLILVTESVDQMISDYAWDTNDWTNWQAGNFSGSSLV